MIHLPIFLFGQDTSGLGRFEKSALSPQMLMELFVQGITDPQKIHGPSEEPPMVDKWIGVKLDVHGNIIEVFWYNLGIHGSLTFCWIPDSTKKFYAQENSLIGSLCLDDLSNYLIEFSVSTNQLHGSLHLEKCPSAIQELFLSENSFQGTVCLDQLPKVLRTIDISGNSLSGPIHLSKLPQRIQAVFLQDNAFSVETDFESLPKSLKYLNVSNTKLSGEIFIEREQWKNFVVFSSNVKRLVKV